MDLANMTFIALVVITVVAVLKEKFPTMTGNTTRLAALIIGGFLGLLAQINLLPIVGANVVTGVMAGVAALSGVTVADRAGGK